jgi:hypothetical protein
VLQQQLNHFGGPAIGGDHQGWEHCGGEGRIRALLKEFFRGREIHVPDGVEQHVCVKALGVTNLADTDRSREAVFEQRPSVTAATGAGNATAAAAVMFAEAHHEALFADSALWCVTVLDPRRRPHSANSAGGLRARTAQDVHR